MSTFRVEYTTLYQETMSIYVNAPTADAAIHQAKRSIDRDRATLKTKLSESFVVTSSENLSGSKSST